MLGLLRNLFNYNEREIRRLSREVERINALEPEMVRLTDAELRAKTDEFRRRLADGETLDDLLHEPSPSCGRPPGACSACGPSTSS